MLSVRARALLDDRLAPNSADVVSMALTVLRHRMALSFAARADGATIDELIGQLLARIGEAEAAA